MHVCTYFSVILPNICLFSSEKITLNSILLSFFSIVLYLLHDSTPLKKPGSPVYLTPTTGRDSVRACDPAYKARKRTTSFFLKSS